MTDNQNTRSADAVADDRREKEALQRFKLAVKDLVGLFRHAVKADTVYMCWVNRSRNQFVFETVSTQHENTIFEDRLPFDDHFLAPYRDVNKIVDLQVGSDISPEELTHYYESVQVNHITLIPFVSKGETVAITVVESREASNDPVSIESADAYAGALSNLLFTYLELSDMSEKEKGWEKYEEQLEQINDRLERVQMMENLSRLLLDQVPGGIVHVAARGMDSWNHVFSAGECPTRPSAGLHIEDKSLAWAALESGKPEFAIHFNGTPRRLNQFEPLATGASLAIPLLVNERRQIVMVVNHANPLLFKDSCKHRLINLVRVASLKLQSGRVRISVDDDLLSNDFSAYRLELIEKVIDIELEHIRNGNGLNTWAGFATPENLAGLRTKYRLESLRDLQRMSVLRLNPNAQGANGLVGLYTEYLFLILVQDRREDALAKFENSLRASSGSPMIPDGDDPAKFQFLTGFVKLDESFKDSYDVIKSAKDKLNTLIRSGAATRAQSN
ncbi:MAG: hypothetical protein ACNA8K_11320 [Cyclonatronaceae bacterium]